MREPEPASSKLEALVYALELMGFDANRLADAMRAPNDPYWKFLALMSVRVEYDQARAEHLQSQATPLCHETAQAWLKGVRRLVPFALLHDPLLSGHADQEQFALVRKTGFPAMAAQWAAEAAGEGAQ